MSGTKLNKMILYSAVKRAGASDHSVWRLGLDPLHCTLKEMKANCVMFDGALEDALCRVQLARAYNRCGIGGLSYDVLHGDKDTQTLTSRLIDACAEMHGLCGSSDTATLAHNYVFNGSGEKAFHAKLLALSGLADAKTRCVFCRELTDVEDLHEVTGTDQTPFDRKYGTITRTLDLCCSTCFETGGFKR